MPDTRASVRQRGRSAPDTNGSCKLPDEPPAPAPPSEGLGDLDIGDIQDLVRQAWEDETAIGDAGLIPDPAGSPVADSIETAMEEIAAAVVQSADSASLVDVEAMKSEIIAAMRTELQAVVESDLRSIVKAAVRGDG